MTNRADAAHWPSVIFIHGLWLKPNSWDRWVGMFEAAGYAGLAPGWPAEAGGANTPETIDQLVAHFKGVAAKLPRRPAVVGHAFGGLIAQVLAVDGVSAASVAIDPVQFRSALVSGAPRAAPRGPFLVMSSAPPQSRDPQSATEFVQLTPRGPEHTIAGWHEAAQIALSFVSRFL